MPKHEFGILIREPERGKRYDKYEPQKCITLIAVDDKYIEPLLEPLSEIELYSHTIDISTMGLVYYGITLIPPTAIDKMLTVIGENNWAYDLRTMLKEAKRDSKYIIHYGV